MFTLMGKKIITILRSESFLIGPMLILSYTHLLRRNVGFLGSSHKIGLNFISLYKYTIAKLQALN